MVAFEKFVKRLEQLPKYLQSKGGDLLMKEQRRIVDLNNAQLLKGRGIDNNIMQTGYSPGYARKRQRSGLQTSFVDLKFTGAYQDSRKLQKVSGGVNVISDVDYEKYLRGNFPTHVGLTKESADEVSEALADDVAKLIEKYLTT